MTRFSLVLSLLVISACGNSTGSNTGANTGKFGSCYGTSGQTCTGIDGYETCIIGACDSQFKACYGASYQSGSFSGSVCASFITCIQGCNCDSGCTVGCASNASAECKSCLQTAGQCVASATCTMPTCTGSAADGGGVGGSDAGASGMACAMLRTCCPKLPSGAQAGCNNVANGGTNDQCQQLLTSFGSACN